MRPFQVNDFQTPKFGQSDLDSSLLLASMPLLTAVFSHEKQTNGQRQVVANYNLSPRTGVRQGGINVLVLCSNNVVQRLAFDHDCVQTICTLLKLSKLCYEIY
jgi:hypothetical protein